jgi:hypothetical protein
MAHELVHVYMLYLLCRSERGTPEKVTCPPYGTRRVGESGRHWERHVLGGIFDMRGSPAPDDKEVVAIRQGEKYWILKPEAVSGLVSRQFDDFLNPRKEGLNDESYPRGTLTELRNRFYWTTTYEDLFPPEDSAAIGGLQMPRDQIDWLTGPGVIQMPQYNIAGHELRDYALQRRNNIHPIQA